MQCWAARNATNGRQNPSYMAFVRLQLHTHEVQDPSKRTWAATTVTRRRQEAASASVKAALRAMLQAW